MCVCVCVCVCVVGEGGGDVFCCCFFVCVGWGDVFVSLFSLYFLISTQKCFDVSLRRRGNSNEGSYMALGLFHHHYHLTNCTSGKN